RGCRHAARRRTASAHLPPPDAPPPLMPSRGARGLADAAAKLIPKDVDEATVATGKGRQVRLTTLRKIFCPALGLTKGDLIRYYVTVSPLLLPHLENRAMVMRRYPD